MRKINALLSIAIALAASANVSAQKYPSTDGEGNTIYYKIMSASPGYENKCLEDNSINSSKSDYKFLINDSKTDNQYQEWELVADASSNDKYYLRNRKSRRYVSTKGSWVENYMSVENAVTKQSTKPYEFVQLSKNQIAIKFNDGTTDRYIGAIDSAQTAPRFDRNVLEDSRWAWYVADQNGTPVSISAITADVSSDISVENRRIVVKGNDNYEIYDTEGRRLSKNGTRLPGVYIVKTKDSNYKVAVE